MNVDLDYQWPIYLKDRRCQTLREEAEAAQNWRVMSIMRGDQSNENEEGHEANDEAAREEDD